MKRKKVQKQSHGEIRLFLVFLLSKKFVGSISTIRFANTVNFFFRAINIIYNMSIKLN